MTECNQRILISLAFRFSFIIASGIGLSAAKTLVKLHPNNRIILACRTKEKADYAREQVLSVLPDAVDACADRVIPLECDHCSLASVRNFVVNLRRTLDETYHPDKWTYNGIDALCLNAAVIFAEGSPATFTEDGMETTFQTNHLAPFMISYLTRDYINPGGRVIFTTSGLHLRYNLDLHGMMDSQTGAIRKRFEMINGSEFHYKESYSMAKLCNVAVCAELNINLQQHRNAISVCFSPGLMLDSGLFRHQQASVHPVPEAHREAVMRKAKTVDWGAGALAYMCWADEPGRTGAVYWRDESDEACNAVYGDHFCPTLIKPENVSVAAQKQLWGLSCELAGIRAESAGYNCTVG